MIRPKVTEAHKKKSKVEIGVYTPVKQQTPGPPEGWIGVDLDGTLAYYDGYQGPGHIGAPIHSMVDRVKKWLQEGKSVRIFTARITPRSDDARDIDEITVAYNTIVEWVKAVFGQNLPITNVKDHGLIELWDDRVRQVETNTGRIKPDGFIDDTDIIPGEVLPPDAEIANILQEK